MHKIMNQRLRIHPCTRKEKYIKHGLKAHHACYMAKNIKETTRYKNLYNRGCLHCVYLTIKSHENSILSRKTYSKKDIKNKTQDSFKSNLNRSLCSKSACICFSWMNEKLWRLLILYKVSSLWLKRRKNNY